MQNALNKLSSEISTFKAGLDLQEIDSSKLSGFKEKCVVALMAGGEGSRFKSVSGSGVNKNAFKLGNEETMIERTINMYVAAGITQFVALVFHHADSIIDLLGDGSKYGATITYSHDPEIPVGKGGAVKNALENGSIPRDSYLIVHNPDDQVVGNTNKILESIISQHIYFESLGGNASVIVVKGAPIAYTGMKVEQSKVTDIEMYPFVPIPSHVGMTVFSPGVYELFDELFSLEKKSDFEQILFPVLKENGQLYAIQIPVDSWIPVNDEKGLKKLSEYISNN